MMSWLLALAWSVAALRDNQLPTKAHMLLSTDPFFGNHEEINSSPSC